MPQTTYREVVRWFPKGGLHPPFVSYLHPLKGEVPPRDDPQHCPSFSKSIIREKDRDCQFSHVLDSPQVNIYIKKDGRTNVEADAQRGVETAPGGGGPDPL